MAFNDAICDMLSGRIDYAVVGGTSSIYRPQTSVAFNRLHMLSPEVRAPGFTQLLKPAGSLRQHFLPDWKMSWFMFLEDNIFN
jgi:3-oxoacyl-(acyl-carrier-protein) synthase